jgi:hypothetical protein
MPTGGGLLRKVFSWQNLAEPLVSVLAGCAGCGVRRHSRWDWRDELPLLLLVSVPATSYGWVSTKSCAARCDSNGGLNPEKIDNLMKASAFLETYECESYRLVDPSRRDLLK